MDDIMSTIDLKNIFESKLVEIKPHLSQLNYYLTVNDNTANQNLFYDNTEENFDRLTKLLTNSEILKSFSQLITKYYNWNKLDEQVSTKITPRILLSAWSIASFPEIVLSEKKQNVLNAQCDPHIYLIYKDSNEVIKSITELSENLSDKNYSKFITSFNDYSNSFDIYISKDKIITINRLIVQWYETKKNISLISSSSKYSKEQKVQSINEINIFINKIIESIKTIYPKFNFEELTKYEILRDHINDELVLAYNAMLFNDLNEKKYVVCKKIINEIKTTFKILQPNTSERIDSLLDEEMIESLHSKDILKIENITYLFDSIIELLKEITSSEADSFIINESLILKGKYLVNSNDLNNLNHYIKDVFIFTMKQLDDVIQNVINLQTLVDLNINPLIN